MTIGQRVKNFRQEAGLTIPQLADLTGLSKGFISQVENDKASLSLESLQKIALAMNLPVKSFLAEETFAPELIRKEARQRLKIGDQPEVEFLSPPFGRQLQIMMVELPAGYQAGGCSHSHDGEEWILVISGKVKVTQGTFFAILEEGDSIHLDGSSPHLCQNAIDSPTKVMVAVTPPAKLPLSKID